MKQKIQFIFCSILFLLPIHLFADGYEPVSLYLTWMRHPDTSMVICWLTNPNETEDIVEFRAECDTQWLQAKGAHQPLPNNTPYLIHSIELTHLNPNSAYYFRIGSKGHSYKFQTMPASSAIPVRFVVGGDIYHDGIELVHATNRQAAKTSPMFAIVGGDLAYASSRKSGFLPGWSQALFSKVMNQKFDRWLEWLIAWKEDMVTPDGRLIPMIPVLGNHDVIGGFDQTPSQAPYFFSLFPMPGLPGYNVLDFGDYMSVILLDSGHANPIKGKQTEWLATTLRQRQSVPQKFAIYHVPAYPSIRDYQDEHCCEVRKYWPPIFDQYHLNVAFEHHDHDYKRTYPLTGGKITPGGVLYLGDGAWGVDEPRVPKKKAPASYIEKIIPSRHFIYVVIQEDKGYAAAISAEGSLLDEVSW